MVCTRCQGSGRCRECDGAGQLPCPQCGGKGRWERSNGQSVRCSRCQGTGLLACATDCESCTGTGQITPRLQQEVASRYQPGAVAEVAGGMRVTVAVASIMFGVHLLVAVLFGSSNLLQLDPGLMPALGAYIPSLVAAGEWWRLLTAGFVHGGLMHLVFNVAALVALGQALEGNLGSARFWVLLSLSMVGGFAARFVLVGVGGPGSLGASGGLLGMVGYGLVAARQQGRSVEQNYFSSWLMSVLLLSMVMGADHVVHAGGFVVGAGLAWCEYRPGGRMASPGVWKALALLLLGLVLVAIACLLRGGLAHPPAHLPQQGFLLRGGGYV